MDTGEDSTTQEVPDVLLSKTGDLQFFDFMLFHIIEMILFLVKIIWTTIIHFYETREYWLSVERQFTKYSVFLNFIQLFLIVIALIQLFYWNTSDLTLLVVIMTLCSYIVIIGSMIINPVYTAYEVNVLNIVHFILLTGLALQYYHSRDTMRQWYKMQIIAVFVSTAIFVPILYRFLLTTGDSLL